MSGISLFLLMALAIWAIAFFAIPLFLWTILLAGMILALQYFQLISLSAWIFWFVFLGFLLPLNIPPLRRLATAKIFNWFKAVLPAMSETEKQAIEAGDTNWERTVFQGRPDWKELTQVANPKLTEEEQRFLDNQVNTLCHMLDDWQIVKEAQDLPLEVWEYIKNEKFFGMIIPKEYGGLGFSEFAHSSVITKIGTRSVSAAVTVMVPNSLGPAELLLKYGTSEQKDYYLPRLAKGEEIPCFALTGPEAGSDAGAIPDKGIVAKGQFKGKEVLGIRLTIDKRYITLAPVATVMGVAFKLYDPDKLLGEKTDLGITLCLLPTDLPGLEIGKRHSPLNMAFMNGPIRATSLFVPIDWIIGGVQMVGQGWRMLMECLSAGRGISLPALSMATGIVCYRTSGAYAAIRRQFNVMIGAFEGVEEALARIGGYTYLLQALRVYIAGTLMRGTSPAVATAIAKYHMTEMARKIINDAMDIHGGRGIMVGPKNYLHFGYQAIPISITVEGANILTRSLMIFGQGAIRCHPYIKAEMDAVLLSQSDAKRALKQFDKNFISHVGYFCSNLVRSFTFSLTRGYFSATACQKEFKRLLQKVNWLSAGLAFSTELALIFLGGELKRKEKLSARLGDVLSQLYMTAVTYKYYYDAGKPESDNVEASWVIQNCLYKAEEALYAFMQNFPNRFVRFLLRLFVFPYGKILTSPSDKLGKEVAKSMLNPSQVREKLTHLCYYEKREDDPIGLMELTFEKWHQVENAMKTLLQAIKKQDIAKNIDFDKQVKMAISKGILGQEEGEALKEYEALYKLAISVDEFDSQESEVLCKTEPMLNRSIL